MNRTIIRILSCFIVNKVARKNFRSRLEIISKKRDFSKSAKILYKEYKPKYSRIVNRLKEEIKYRKIRVVFLCSETAKWNLQTVYNAMLKSKEFEPILVLSTRLKYYTPEIFKHNIDFFKKLCPNFEIGFDEETKKSIDLKNFNPDIVFYQEPWDLFNTQKIDSVSDYALTCYCPYTIAEGPATINVMLKGFHFKLWKHFIADKSIEKQYNKVFNYSKGNIVVSGHPKLDIYKGYHPDIIDKKYVIYAPHHALSFSWIKYSTFDWNGKYILEFAKQHPEINWVFKPHPDLKRAVWFNEKLMTKEEIEDYYEEWKKIALYYDDGNYFDLFKQSRCLITDCSSFLTEYLATNSPVIHLRTKSAVEFMPLNEKIIKYYYKAWNLKDLENLLENIVIRKKDPMKKKRNYILNKLNLNKYEATENIMKELKKELL